MMRKSIPLLLALVAVLALAASASAKPLHCKRGTHRNGHKCVKNHTAGSKANPTPGPVVVVPGPVGPAGPVGPVGPTGPIGPEGPTPTPRNGYENIAPESLSHNPVSLGYAATGTTEFGSQIALAEAGGIRDPQVEVLMSVWSCETGEWNAGCVTTPGSSFAAPLTLNAYAVGPENTVGALLATDTQTFDLPYRPTSAGCADATKFATVDGTCQHGLPVLVSFNLASLPHKVILSVSFAPTGPLASLNVGLEGPATSGSNPVETIGGIYWDSQSFGTKVPGFHYEAEPSEWSVGESQMAVRLH